MSPSHQSAWKGSLPHQRCPPNGPASPSHRVLPGSAWRAHNARNLAEEVPVRWLFFSSLIGVAVLFAMVARSRADHRDGAAPTGPAGNAQGVNP